jgi:hypothetical protein
MSGNNKVKATSKDDDSKLGLRVIADRDPETGGDLEDSFEFE